MMDWIATLLSHDGKFLGIEWGFWKLIGWLGNLVFFTRFIVQWHATEKHKRVVVPVLFWWLSLSGSLLLLAYAVFYKRDSVFIFAYAFTWIPYIRNLIIHHRHLDAHIDCVECGRSCQPNDHFCAACGGKLDQARRVP